MEKRLKPSLWVVKFAELVPKKSKVLDLACGKGRHTRLFIERSCQVTAVDINTSGLGDLVKNPNCHSIALDLEQSESWLLPSKFNCIVVTNYLFRPNLKYIADALLPEGILIYQTFMSGHEKFGKPSNPDFLLKENELLETFEKDLEIIEFSQGLNPSPSMTQQICARKKK